MRKSRSGSQGSSAAPPPQSIEAVRRRARHRLIGAAVLVLLGVLGFPMLFDTEPRPVAGDIPIEIPSRGSTALIAETREPAPSEPEPEAESVNPALSARDGLDASEEVVESSPREVTSPPIPSTVTRAVPKSDPPAAAPIAAKPATPDKTIIPPKNTRNDKAETAAAEAARAKALLESKAPVGAERLVVQVGAFASTESANAARQKLERAGIKTYTHVADTAAGKLTRVRAGPFSSRAEADRVAAQITALGLPARILTL